MDNDTSWCPVCDCQILPKRLPVPSNPAPNHRTRPRPRSRLQPPPKQRFLIDQGPTPLYCSDRCQLADLRRGLPSDFNPAREPPPASPCAVPAHPDDVSSCSSLESLESPVSPSLATLAQIYRFPPLPPPAPVPEPDPEFTSVAESEYSSGIIMAARRITAELTPPPPKKDPYGRDIREPRKPIPGWTDGSTAWRSEIYSLSAAKPSPSFSARSPLSSRSRPAASSDAPPTPPSDAEMLYKFSESFTHCASRVSNSSVSVSRASSSPCPKRERPFLRPGTESKLLVPDVMLRVSNSSSTTSLSSQWSATSSRPTLSRHSSLSDGDSASSRFHPSHPKRPTVEMRSWSYDNVKTYPIMQLPPKTKIEKRKELRIVDGKEVQVDVEVEVPIVEPLKRLFLFEPKLATTLRP